MIRAAKRLVSIPIFVLIRARDGDFVFSPAEVAQMHDEVADAVSAGADGVVIGALTPAGTVDVAACRDIAAPAAAAGLPVTFHRAVDVCPDMLAAAEAAAAAGATRILTSGGRATALAGAHGIAKLSRALAGTGVTAMAGAGVTADTALETVQRCEVAAIHGTFRGPPVPGPAKFRSPHVCFAPSGNPEDDYTRRVTDPEAVRRAVQAVAHRPAPSVAGGPGEP